MANDGLSRISGKSSIGRSAGSRAAMTLADAATGDPEKIECYILDRHAAALRRWNKASVPLSYDDPAQQLRARVYEVGCALIQNKKADGLISVLSNVRGGRGRAHGSVFGAIFGVLSDDLPYGFSETNCRKAAAVMEAAHFYEVHPRYVILFAAGMKGWTVPIKPSTLGKPPAWVHGLTRAVHDRKPRA